MRTYSQLFQFVVKNIGSRQLLSIGVLYKYVYIYMCQASEHGTPHQHSRDNNNYK